MKSTIKKILISEGYTVNKLTIGNSHNNNLNTITDFLVFCCDSLGIENDPVVTVADNRDGLKTTASYSPSTNTIVVYGKGRHVVDVLRSLAHELVHVRQNELGQIKDPTNDTKDGTPIENEANSKAGQLIRGYGRKNPKIYE